MVALRGEVSAPRMCGYSGQLLGLDESALRQMLAESVRAGAAAVGGDRVVLDRARVLAEHGVMCIEDVRAFDRFVAALGGSLRRARGHGRERLYWELPRAALDAGSDQAAAHPQDGSAAGA